MRLKIANGMMLALARRFRSLTHTPGTRFGLGHTQSAVQCVNYAFRNRSQSLGRAAWGFDRIFGCAIRAFRVAGLGASLVPDFNRIRIRQRDWEQQYYLYPIACAHLLAQDNIRT